MLIENELEYTFGNWSGNDTPKPFPITMFALSSFLQDSREKPGPAPLSALGGASLSSAHSPLQRSLSTPSSWGRGEVHSLEELFPPGPGGSIEEEGPHSGRSSSISSEGEGK